MRATLNRRIWIECHAYALILKFYVAVPMAVPREVLSKGYAACGVKNMFPWCLEIDRRDNRFFVTLGVTTDVTLSRWPSCVCIAVCPTCVQGTVWLVTGLVLWRTGRGFWIDESSFLCGGCAPSTRYTYSDICGECAFRWQGALFQCRFGGRYGFALDVPYGTVPIQMNDVLYGDEDAPRACILGPCVWVW